MREAGLLGRNATLKEKHLLRTLKTHRRSENLVMIQLQFCRCASTFEIQKNAEAGLHLHQI